MRKQFILPPPSRSMDPNKKRLMTPKKLIKMAIPYTSSPPVRLDKLLQVPLKLIPLEDLISERSSLAPQPKMDMDKTAVMEGNRLCHSADSPASSSRNSPALQHGKVKSYSSPCLFDCCATPSRWKKSGPYSNHAKFTSTAVMLPNGSMAVIPVMMPDNEETMSDIEMRSDYSNEAEETSKIGGGPNIHSNSSHVTGKSAVSGARPLRSYADLITATRRSSSTSSMSPPSATHVPVVLGKVTDNPTRFEDLLSGQDRGESNNNNFKSSDRNIQCTASRNGEVITPTREEQTVNVGKKQFDSASEDNMLKLTFYNDGRKQSEKEFRTSGNRENAPGDGGGVPTTATQDSRYFENQHGLQLSRVLRGIEQEEEPTPTQRHGTTTINEDNTQDKTGPANSPLIVNNNNDKTWEQWNGLQISRCQKDSPEKVQTFENEPSTSYSPHNNNEREKNINSQNREGEKKDGENLIDRHIQSVLTSMRYVRTGQASGGISGRGNAERSPPAPNSVPTAVIDHAKSNSTNSRPLVHAEVERGGGIVRLTPQVQTSPVRPVGTTIPISSRGANKIAAIMHASPPTYHHNNHHQQAQPRASDGSSWHERAIARIPTRPFLLKNNTYEVQRNPPQNHVVAQTYGHQPGMVPPMAQPTAPSSLHSTPKRFKPANIPVTPHTARQQHPQQLHGFTPPNQNRYYPNANNGIAAPPTTVHGGGAGSADRYYPNSVQHPQHLAQPHALAPHLSPGGNRGHVTSYGNGHSVPLYSPNKSPSHGVGVANNIPSPYRSPQGVVEPLRNIQNSRNSHQFHPLSAESLMIAAAVTANASKPEPIDQADYYERLRYYYESYQLDWTKLAEYYQKWNSHPWEAPSSQNEQLHRQWRSQPPTNTDVGSGGHNVTNMAQQQQTALRAMEAAASRGQLVAAGGNNKGIAPFQFHPNPAATGQHGRVTKMANFSPPQLSPSSSLQNIQMHSKFTPTPNPHQQQLRQIQERHYQNQIHQQHQQQQQQLRYQASQQAQAQQQPHHGYPPHYPPQQQAPQPSPSYSKVPAAPTAIPANYEIQNTPEYRNAYNQLAAAAGVIASAANTQQQRPSVIDVVQNHLRTSLHNLNHSSNVAPANNPQQEVRYRPNPNPSPTSKINHHSGIASITPVRNHSLTNHITPSPTTPPTPINEVPFISNIHRQTLEQAIKNSFKSSATDPPPPISNHHNSSGGNTILNPRYITITPSPSPPSIHPSPSAQISRESWSKDVSGSSPVGFPNMNREPLRTASSPTLAHQTLVIRRVQQPPQLSPVNTVLRKAPQLQPMDLDNRATPPQRFNYSNNHEGVLKRRINIISNRSPPEPDHSPLGAADQFHNIASSSPIPLVVGEEEIVTTSVSPSTVLTTINPVDDRDGEVLQTDDVTEDSINHPKPSSGDEGNGSWQYDHVVLLDKRTMTYMCKRCFETLKTEQEIRNHLFCKMLAGHVRCHVCFQLLKSEQYPEHLQVHGVRPPEDEEEESHIMGK